MSLTNDNWLATPELVALLNLPASINRRSAAGELSKRLARHFAERGARVLVDRFGQRFWPAEEEPWGGPNLAR
ncbi:MAG: hypothetical protein U1E17_12660 [Geminicoccaceae bacterium]